MASKISVGFLAAVISLAAFADETNVHYTVRAGDLKSSSSWCTGSYPDYDDTFVITNAITYTEGGQGNVKIWEHHRYNDVTVGAGGTYTVNGNRAHFYHNRITVEDGGLFSVRFATDQWGSLEGNIRYGDGLVVRIRDGGLFRQNRHGVPGLTLVLTPSCVMADGELWFDYPGYPNKGTKNGELDFYPLGFTGTAAVKGTEIHAGYLVPKTADSVLRLEAGAIYLMRTEDDGLWAANGAYLDFRPYSTLELCLTNGVGSASELYALYFAGDTPRIRYNGAAVASADFATLFEASDGADGFTHLKLKAQTSDVILTDGLVSPGRTYDNQWLKPLEYFRVVSPATGASVAYSTDGGTTWTDRLPRLRDAGTHTVTVRTTASGFADRTETFTQTIAPKEASAFTVVAQDANYTGQPITPELTIADSDPFGGTLKAGVDYTMECEDNVNIGTATCHITYAGNYSGSATVTFKILAAKRAGDLWVDASASSGGDGTAAKPFATLGDAIKTTLGGGTIHLAAGDYVLNETCSLSKTADLSLVGAGRATTTVRVADGAFIRHFNLENVTNVLFRDLSFRNARCEVATGDATSGQGGSFRITASQKIAFEGCSFVSNRVQNTTSAVASEIPQCGGALYVSDTDLRLVGCEFVENLAYNDQVYAGWIRGGAIYMTTPTGASASKLRLNLGVTNCVFRSNGLCSRRSGTVSVSDGAALALYSVGADFHNCLITGGYPHESTMSTVRSVVYDVGTGAFHRYEQCTLADSAASSCFHYSPCGAIAASGYNVPAILIRTIVTGHWRDFYLGGDLSSILIDSVYSTGTAPAASKKLFGTTYTSSNWVKDTSPILLTQEGVALPGSSAAARNAGWRPTDGRTRRTWYVAVTGSDEGDGTAASPLRTFAKAVRSCQDGDTIELAAGTYSPAGGETYPYDFADKVGITVAGAGRGATILDGAGDSGGKRAFRLFHTHGFRMRDLTIRGMDPKVSAAGTPVIASVASCGHPVFHRVDICDNGLTAGKAGVSYSGLFAMSWSALVDFADCRLTNNVYRTHANGSNSDGWMWSASWCFSQLRNCLVAGNGIDTSLAAAAGKGGTHKTLLVNSSSINTQLSGCFNACNCLFYGNGHVAGDASVPTIQRLFLSLTSDPTGFENCTFADTCSLVNAMAHFERTTGNDLYVNSIFVQTNVVALQYGSGNAKACLFREDASQDASLSLFKNAATLAADGCLFGDAGFRSVARRNYRLGSDSPAIDAALTRDWMSDDVEPNACDLDGRSRCVGYRKKSVVLPDMGCYEKPRPTGLALIVR